MVMFELKAYNITIGEFTLILKVVTRPHGWFC